MTPDDKREHGIRLLTEGLASIGARTATTGNRRERREAARVLRSIPDGAQWYMPQTPRRRGWR